MTGFSGLYIHIPFCLKKCVYCDFVSLPGHRAWHAAYVQALCHEAERRAGDWDQACFDSVFFGGGTPTVLPLGALISVLDTCRRHLHLVEGAEITLEANPGTVDTAALCALREAGANRLSLGMQSLHDDELSLLGRIHKASEAIRAYHMTREAGFTNVNLDLMFGLPGQRLERWRETLQQALGLKPEHLSLYALAVEPDTPLAVSVAAGRVPSPDDDLAAEMYALAETMLAEEGYVHYEISNWARMRAPDTTARREPALLPGTEEYLAYACRHNLKYWRNERYLGLGLAAASYDGYGRGANTTDLASYVASLNSGEDPILGSMETCDEARRMDETMMLGIRLIAGISWESFRYRFGVDPRGVYNSQITELMGDGLLQADDLSLRLTPRGRLLGNRVFAAFLRTP